MINSTIFFKSGKVFEFLEVTKRNYMYIIELIANIINNHKKRKIKDYKLEQDDEYESCEHIYFAIDSTKDYFACSKCGNVIKNNKKPSG